MPLAGGWAATISGAPSAGTTLRLIPVKDRCAGRRFVLARRFASTRKLPSA